MPSTTTTLLPGSWLLGKACQAAIKVFRIVMAEANDGCLTHLAGIIDAGVAIGIDQEVIVGAGHGRDDAEISLITRREDHAVLMTEEGGERLFQGAMATIVTIGDR